MKKTGAAKKKNGQRGQAKKVGPYNPDEWIAERKERTFCWPGLETEPIHTKCRERHIWI